MKLIKTANKLTILLDNLRAGDNLVTIGFVPTMGALHEGHLSLIERSTKENDITICSIFVNPTQFGEKKDLETYPRPIEADIDKLISAGCDILFLPEVDEVYPPSYQQQEFDLQGLDFKIEGKQRPGHFQGVCNVIYRFFTIIQPDKAYFGQKDFQQTVVVKRLVKLMNSKTEIVVVPISREANGLAMSSRNQRLSDKHRAEAHFIHDGLLKIKDLAPKVGLKAAMDEVARSYASVDGAVIEYLTAVDPISLDEVEELGDHTAVLTVVRFHDVRLLDNIILN